MIALLSIQIQNDVGSNPEYCLNNEATVSSVGINTQKEKVAIFLSLSAGYPDIVQTTNIKPVCNHIFIQTSLISSLT